MKPQCKIVQKDVCVRLSKHVSEIVRTVQLLSIHSVLSCVTLKKIYKFVIAMNKWIFLWTNMQTYFVRKLHEVNWRARKKKTFLCFWIDYRMKQQWRKLQTIPPRGLATKCSTMILEQIWNHLVVFGIKPRVVSGFVFCSTLLPDTEKTSTRNMEWLPQILGPQPLSATLSSVSASNHLPGLEHLAAKQKSLSWPWTQSWSFMRGRLPHLPVESQGSMTLDNELTRSTVSGFWLRCKSQILLNQISVTSSGSKVVEKAAVPFSCTVFPYAANRKLLPISKLGTCFVTHTTDTHDNK